MKVGNTSSNQIQETESTQNAKKTQKVERGKAKPADAASSSSVNAEVSGRAKEMSKARQVAENAADVRESKIAELKKRIAAGEYNVKPEAVAEKMVKEHLETHDLG